jgi:uncharacterized protein YjiK
MKNSRYNTVAFFALAIVFFASCQDNKMESRLIGKWRIAQMKIQYYEQQATMGNAQIQMLQDSLAKTTDSTLVAQYNMQIGQIQNQLQSFKAQQDTAMKKSSWEFKKGGDFVANESEGPRNGIWSYDDTHKMLFTVIDKQASSVTVEFTGDTMILRLDSVNYMKFAPMKE